MLSENGMEMQEDEPEHEEIDSMSIESSEIDSDGDYEGATTQIDSNIVKVVQAKGRRGLKAGEGADVILNFKIYYGVMGENQTFISREGVNFVVGVPELSSDLEMLSRCAETMRFGEVAVFSSHTPNFWNGLLGNPPFAAVRLEDLKLEIEMVSFIADRDISLDYDGSLILRVYEPSLSKDVETPEELATLTITFEASLEDGRVLKSAAVEPVVFVWDEGVQKAVPKAVLTALMHMHPGEKAKVTVHSKDDLEGATFMDVPEKDCPAVYFDVHLIEANIPVNQHDIDDPEEQIANAELMKQEGNIRFNNRCYMEALRRYEKALSYVEDSREVGFELKWPIYLNIAACKLQLEDFNGAVESCDKVLDRILNNIKALYRRGCALFALDRFDEARRDFRRILELEPKNKGALRKLHEVTERIKEHSADLKRSYAGWMSRSKVKGFASDGRTVDMSLLKELPKIDPPSPEMIGMMKMMMGMMKGQGGAPGGMEPSKMGDAPGGAPGGMDPSKMGGDPPDGAPGGMDPSKMVEMMSKMGGDPPEMITGMMQQMGLGQDCEGESQGMDPGMMQKMGMDPAKIMEMMTMMKDANKEKQDTSEFNSVQMMEKLIKLTQPASAGEDQSSTHKNDLSDVPPPPPPC